MALKNTTIVISSSTPGFNCSVSVGSVNGMAIQIPTTVMQTSGKAFKYVHVQATSAVSVTTMTYVPGHTADGYLAIPSSRLGTLYNFYNDHVGISSLVALFDNTNITIAVVRQNQNNGTSFFSITLDKYQSFVARCWFCLGYVNASHPIALRYGSYQACCAYTTFRTSYIEEAVEVHNSPLTFIVPMFSASHSHTVNCVSVRDLQMNAANNTNRQFQYISYFKSATYISTNHSASCTYTGNGFSTIIPAVTSYAKYYRFLTPSVTTFIHHAAVMILTSAKDGVRVDNSQPTISKQDTVTVHSTSYSVLYLNITSGQHDITHTSPSVSFGVILYGFAVNVNGSYAYPGGFKLN